MAQAVAKQAVTVSELGADVERRARALAAREEAWRLEFERRLRRSWLSVSPTGCMGVSRLPRGRFAAQHSENGKLTHLGFYATAVNAAAA